MIELKDIVVKFGDFEALHNINVNVKEGEFFTFLGPSGCGKTTLTRLINGLTPEYYEGKLNGVVLVNGKDTVKTPLYELSKTVGSVFQNPRSQFFNVDTTGEIAFGCENIGLPKEEIYLKLGYVKT